MTSSTCSIFNDFTKCACAAARRAVGRHYTSDIGKTLQETLRLAELVLLNESEQAAICGHIEAAGADTRLLFCRRMERCIDAAQPESPQLYGLLEATRSVIVELTGTFSRTFSPQVVAALSRLERVLSMRQSEDHGLFLPNCSSSSGGHQPA